MIVSYIYIYIYIASVTKKVTQKYTRQYTHTQNHTSYPTVQCGSLVLAVQYIYSILWVVLVDLGVIMWFREHPYSYPLLISSSILHKNRVI